MEGIGRDIRFGVVCVCVGSVVISGVYCWCVGVLVCVVCYLGCCYLKRILTLFYRRFFRYDSEE